MTCIDEAATAGRERDGRAQSFPDDICAPR
jgi:hypothetical protein